MKKQTDKQCSETLSNIDYVVGENLCTRCGACFGACPHEAIRWDNDFFPHTTDNCTNCNICLDVCGGKEVDFPRYCKEHYGNSYNFTENAIGPILYAEAVHSSDPNIRKNGSSGGLATQILVSLFKQGEIDGAVVAGFSSTNPLEPEAKMARTQEEVQRCAQSKYTIFPVAHIYEEIIRVPGRYAVVGLPCHLHSLFRWREVNPILRNRVVATIGLFCHVNLERKVLDDIAHINNLQKTQVSKLEFRGGEWPGGIRVTMNNGSIVPLHRGDIKDGAFNYLNKLYVAKRCLSCIDYSAELSDISIADPWLRNKQGEYLFQGGWSVAYVRTKRGDNLINDMKQKNKLVAKRLDNSMVLKSTRPLMHFKKRGAFIRIARLSKRGKAFPNYFISSPRVRMMDYLREYIYQISLLGWHFNILRRPLLRLAFSPLGWQLGKCKASIKKWKFRLSSSS